jgi:hypothetical protein
MSNPNNITNPKTLRKYQKWEQEKKILDAKIEILKGMGYHVFQSLKAGTNSSWSYQHNGKDSGLGFDDDYGPWVYLINKHAAEIDFLQNVETNKTT